MKKQLFLFLIIFCIVLIPISTQAQDYVIDIGIFTEEDTTNINNNTQPTKEELIKRLEELKTQPDSIEKYKEVSYIILQLWSLESDLSIEEKIFILKLIEDNKAMSEKLKILTKKFLKLNEENIRLTNQNKVLERKLQTSINELGILRNNYNNIIDYYQAVVYDLKYQTRHTFLLSPQINLYGNCDLSVLYTINLWQFQIGGGITIQNIYTFPNSPFSDFGIGLGFNILFGFYF